MGYVDSGAVEILREEVDELRCYRCDDHPETASSNFSLSSPRRGRRRRLPLHLWPPDPPGTALFMKIFASLHRYIHYKKNDM
jgi:hypothetical protein